MGSKWPLPPIHFFLVFPLIRWILRLYEAVCLCPYPFPSHSPSAWPFFVGLTFQVGKVGHGEWSTCVLSEIKHTVRIPRQFHSRCVQPRTKIRPWEEFFPFALRDQMGCRFHTKLHLQLRDWGVLVLGLSCRFLLAWLPLNKWWLYWWMPDPPSPKAWEKVSDQAVSYRHVRGGNDRPSDGTGEPKTLCANCQK